MTQKHIALVPLLACLAAGSLHAETPAPAADKPAPQVVQAGSYTYTFDPGTAPDLKGWLETELTPVVKEWYPKIVALLPSEGFTPSSTVTFRFQDDMKGVPAWAAGTTISLNAGWFRNNLKGEARGCVVHEMVHVVQRYGRGKNPTPGWITEGIPDYIRWFLYEPQTKGAELNRGNIANAKYDASYRVTANFLDWVVTSKNKDFVAKLNAAARAGNYTDEIWKEHAGAPLEELGTQWKKAREEKLAGK
ncbi:basic secretory protein-like protein [Luteolibacter sp. LG18]|uniref:basic secretory protein-like protein n=1 Tax=Luteolibacter sp. LG18 TaxID=2819286 RepID=UPI002B2896F5|nr:hypothetical protein llg_45400 [Luteolibacter sp. LG18]